MMGASFMALTLTLIDAAVAIAPPEPLLPKSSSMRLRVVEPLKFDGGVNVSPLR